MKSKRKVESFAEKYPRLVAEECSEEGDLGAVSMRVALRGIADAH